jgi:adenylate cyclase
LSTERVERRLAAILAADIAGYSRLMGLDETGTLYRLRAHRRELIDPKIAEHKGRIVKTTGDGILIEFPSVVEAVACAVAVQHGMGERNAATPEEQRIVFRVGVNLGDIIVEGDDIHGDGVNVAARLEAIKSAGTRRSPIERRTAERNNTATDVRRRCRASRTHCRPDGNHP